MPNGANGESPGRGIGTPGEGERKGELDAATDFRTVEKRRLLEGQVHET